MHCEILRMHKFLDCANILSLTVLGCTAVMKQQINTLGMRQTSVDGNNYIMHTKTNPEMRNGVHTESKVSLVIWDIHELSSRNDPSIVHKDGNITNILLNLYAKNWLYHQTGDP